MSQPPFGVANSALIVWDIQYGIAQRAFNLSEILPNVRLLIEAARTANRPIFFSQQTALPFGSMSKFQIRSLQKRGLDPRTSNFMVENTNDWKIVDEISSMIRTQDIVMKKHTPDFFIGTNLDLLLRARGIESLIITGVATEVGVEATARHGAYLGYVPVIAEDAVGSSDKESHDAALKIMRRMFDVRISEEIAGDLKHSQS